MAKEWDKFQSDYKKLLPQIKKYSVEEASAAKTRVNSANTNCGEGERNLAASMVKARKNGVTGTALPDFIEDKGFAEAYKLMKSAFNMLAEELIAIEAFSKAAAVVQTDVTKLDTAITKDLKGRKDSSASKKEIEGLQEQIATDLKALKEAAGKYDGVEPMKKNLPGNFPKSVAAVLKQAPEAQETKEETETLPMLLVDRNLKSNVSKALKIAKTIGDEIKEALELAATDMGGAATKIKAAAGELKTLSELVKQYQKLKTDYKQDIAVSKDKGKIETAIDTIEKAYTVSESRVRGAATTMKKAG